MQRLTPSEYVTKMLRKHENNWKKLIVFPKMGGSFIFTDGRIHYGEYGLYLIKMLNSRLIPELFLYGGKSSGDADSTTSVPPEIHAGLNSRIKRFCRGLLRKYTAKDGTHRGADAVMDYKDVIGAPHFVPVDEKLMNWGDLTEKKLQDKNGKYDAPLLLNNFEFCMINDIDLNEIQNVETFSDVFGEIQEVARSRTSIYLELEDDMCNRLNTLVNTRGRINWNGYYKTELYDGPTIYDGLTNLASVTINGKTITLNQKKMTFTENASKELRKIMKRENLSPETHAVRMGVKGGGCSGMTYTLDFDDKQRKFDLLYESNGLKLLVDKKSNLYIKNTEIDWSYNLMDRGLKFNNPQAKGSCGCKTSFMVDVEQDDNYTPSWM